jgi:hypothetical protein
MDILKKRGILKLATIFMVVAMMAGAFTMHAKAAVATRAITPCTPTGPAGSADSGGTPLPTGCDIGIIIANSQISGLSFISDGSVTLTPTTPKVGPNAFSFTVDVTDIRTGAGTPLGWQLQAVSSSGLDVLTPAISSITGQTCEPTTTGTPGIACPNPLIVGTGISLNSGNSAASFANTATTDDVSGTVHFTINGTYTIPFGSVPTSYTGTITLSILAAAAAV